MITDRSDKLYLYLRAPTTVRERNELKTKSRSCFMRELKLILIQKVSLYRLEAEWNNCVIKYFNFVVLLLYY